MIATPVTRGTPVLAAQMNAVFMDLGTVMSNMLGGKSFVLAFPNTVPARLLGHPFFFTQGVCAYAPKIPGAVTYTVTVTDILTGLPATGTGVRPYDEAAILAAESAKPVLTYAANQIAIIGDITSYPPGLTRTANVGLCDASLRAHLRLHDGTRFWVKEQTAIFPEKIYRHALAEIIVEGVTEVDLPPGKYRYFRVHNLQPRSCTVTLSGAPFTVGPFECACLVQDFDGFDDDAPLVPKFKNQRRSPIPYFFEWTVGEEPLFWFWNSLPVPTIPPLATLSADGLVLTASGGMQGNNVTNPAVMYDFLFALRETGDTYARFRRDPHVHHSMGRDNAGYFACLKNTPEFPDVEKGQLRADALVGDMFHHVGPVEVHRLPIPAIDGILTTKFQFRGYKTLLDDLALAGFSTLLDANGNLRITRPDAAAYLWDLLCIGTNFLKSTFSNRDVLNQNPWNTSLHWQKIPVGVPLNVAGSHPRTIEDAIFEADVPTAGAAQRAGQDIRGHELFTLRTKPSYRIYQRTELLTARSIVWRRYDDVNVTVPGAAQESLAYAGGVGGIMGGIHAVPVSRLLTLKDWGDPSRASQDDAHVTYTPPVLIFSPEGWVMTFTESHRADRLPFLMSAAPTSFDPVLFTIPPFAYAANPLNTYRYNAVTNRIELKHCIRFRKHGWGWTQAQKEYALHYSMSVGRLTNPGYQDSVAGPDGKDWALPQTYTETPVKVLRSVLVTEAGTQGGLPVNNARGARFFGDTQPCDGWNSYDTVGRPNWGVGAWRAYRAQLVTDYPDGTTPRESTISPRNPINNAVTAVPTYVPMLAEHYAAMVQAMQQSQNNIPLSRLPLIVFGQKILDFSGTVAGGAWQSWDRLFRNAFGPVPAPVTAYGGLVTAHADAPYYERFLTDNGVTFKGTDVADYPDLATRKTEFSSTDSHRIVADITVDVASGSVITVSGVFHQTYNGTVTIGNWRVDPPVVLNGPVGQARIETLPFITVNLVTEYASRRWVTVDDFKTFSELIGFPFQHKQVFIPLTLDLLHRGTDFQDSAIRPKSDSSFTGLIAVVPSFNPVNQTFPTTWWGWANMTQLTPTSGFKPASTILSGVPRQQLLFRLAETEDEIQWKAAIPTGGDISLTGYETGDYLAFNRKNRSFGRMRTTVGLHLNWNFSGQGMGFGTSSDGRDAPQWNVGTAGANQLSGLVPDFHQERLAGSQTTDPSIRHQLAIAPRWFRDLSDGDIEQDRLAAFINRERRWFAMQIVSSFAGASSVIGSLGVRDWGRRLDWWLEDAPNYNAHLRTGLGDERYAAPRDMAPPPFQAIPVASGLTLLFEPASDGEVRLLEFSP